MSGRPHCGCTPLGTGGAWGEARLSAGRCPIAPGSGWLSPSAGVACRCTQRPCHIRHTADPGPERTPESDSHGSQMRACKADRPPRIHAHPGPQQRENNPASPYVARPARRSRHACSPVILLHDSPLEPAWVVQHQVVPGLPLSVRGRHSSHRADPRENPRPYFTCQTLHFTLSRYRTHGTLQDPFGTHNESNKNV